MICFLLLLYVCDGMADSVAPAFVEQPKNLTVIEGDSIVLRCTVEDLPAINLKPVTWVQGMFSLGYERDMPFDPRYSMVGDLSIGEYHLQIINASLMEDENIYECQVTEFMMRSTKAVLTVLVPPSGPFISNKDLDQSVLIEVVFAKENTLTCQAFGGKPAAILQWYRDGKLNEAEVKSTISDEKHKVYDTNATLLIVPTMDDDNAVYTCIMKSEIYPNKVLGRTLVQIAVLQLPIVSVSLPSFVVAGENAVAECKAKSDLRIISFRWYIQGKEQTELIESKLDLGVVRKTWQGAGIACQAKNKAGVSESSLSILNVSYPPVFLNGPGYVKGNIGDSLTLWCNWDGNPQPSIQWFKAESKKTIISTKSELILSNITRSDSGTFVCTAKVEISKSGRAMRKVGEANAVTKVDVYEAPILRNNSVQLALLGEDAILNCSLLTHPGIDKVEWTWEHRGQNVSLLGSQKALPDHQLWDDVAVIKYSGNHVMGALTAQLKIASVTEHDLHSYTCTVANSYGKTSVNISLKEDPLSSDTIIKAAASTASVVGVVVIVFVALLLHSTFHCCHRQKTTEDVNSSQVDEEATSNNHLSSLSTSNRSSTSGFYHVLEPSLSSIRGVSEPVTTNLNTLPFEDTNFHRSESKEYVNFSSLKQEKNVKGIVESEQDSLSELTPGFLSSTPSFRHSKKLIASACSSPLAQSSEYNRPLKVCLPQVYCRDATPVGPADCSTAPQNSRSSVENEKCPVSPSYHSRYLTLQNHLPGHPSHQGEKDTFITIESSNASAVLASSINQLCGSASTAQIFARNTTLV